MQLYPSPQNPLPPGAQCVDLTTRDGVKLRAMYAIPENPRGTVVFLGGRGDFVERYFETMRDMLARGLAVAAVDLRGQGGSQRFTANPYRDKLSSFSIFDNDLRTLMDDLVRPSCPAPYYAIGHSTGGHLLLRHLKQKTAFRKVVLVSPLVEIVYGPWPRLLAGLLVNGAMLMGLRSVFLPGVRKKPMGRAHFNGNILTSDQWRWNRDSQTLELAPHLGLGGATFGWLFAARRSLASVARMKKPAAPVLIVAAASDRVVGNEGTRRLARNMATTSLAFIPGARHEILTERDDIRRQFLAAFDSFVTSELRP